MEQHLTGNYYPFAVARSARECSHISWEGGFSLTDILKIVGYCETLPKGRGVTDGANAGEELDNIRTSQVSWVPFTPATAWLYEKLAEQISRVNGDHFGFDLTGLFNLQYTVYEAGEKPGHYDWHVDTVGRGQPPRKLSFVVQLSDPMDYEGGELWVHNYNRKVLAKTQGFVWYFPSYVLHRVTPVTSGTRRSLVGWVLGPDFR